MDTDPELLRVAPGLSIPPDELTWRFQTSGGRGGQHANRARTRVEVSFDLAASRTLTEAQRARLQARLGNVVRAAAEDERSQARNREIAVDRLRARLAGALKQDRPRRPTKPTRGSQRRRVDGKRRRGEIKRGRRRPDLD